MHKGAISGTQMSVSINSCLYGLNIHSQEGNQARCWKPSQFPGARSVMELRKESMTNTWLEQHHSLPHAKSSPYTTEKRSYRLSSEKLVFTPITESTTGYKAAINVAGTPSSSGYICAAAPASVAQRTPQKRRKDCKSRKSAVKQSLIDMAATTKLEQGQPQRTC